MTILSKTICRFSTIPIKISPRLLAGIDSFILKLIWNLKGPQYSKSWKNKVVGLTGCDFKTYYKTTVIKAVWH